MSFQQLANRYGQDAEITALLDKYDWMIVPTSNPDGYEYSWASVSIGFIINNKL